MIVMQSTVHFTACGLERHISGWYLQVVDISGATEIAGVDNSARLRFPLPRFQRTHISVDGMVY